jgi:hypothetical protein
MLRHSGAVRSKSLVVCCVWSTTHRWWIWWRWYMTTVASTGKHACECLFRIADSGLLRAGSCTRVKLFSIFKCLSTLLVQSSFLRKHIYYQVDLFPDWVSSVDAIFIVREIAQGRNFVHVAFELDDCWRRSIFDNKFDRCQGFQKAAPLRSNSF